MTVKRIWHAWTTKENADKYQDILNKVVLPGIEAKKIPGYRRMEVLRIDLKSEVEFLTIMTFDSLENVYTFQGEDYKKSYVPEETHSLIKRWDRESTHYTLVETREY